MNTFGKLLNPTHYAVATVAAIAYVLVWLAGARVAAAEPAMAGAAGTHARSQDALAPIIVRATHVTDTVLEPVIVTGSATRFILAPVFLSIGEESDRTGAVTRDARASGLLARLRCWFGGL